MFFFLIEKHEGRGISSNLAFHILSTMFLTDFFRNCESVFGQCVNVFYSHFNLWLLRTKIHLLGIYEQTYITAMKFDSVSIGRYMFMEHAKHAK